MFRFQNEIHFNISVHLRFNLLLVSFFQYQILNMWHDIFWLQSHKMISVNVYYNFHVNVSRGDSKLTRYLMNEITITNNTLFSQTRCLLFFSNILKSIWKYVKIIDFISHSTCNVDCQVLNLRDCDGVGGKARGWCNATVSLCVEFHFKLL